MAKEFPKLSLEDNASVFKATVATFPESGKMNIEQAKRTVAYVKTLGDLKVNDDFDPSPHFTNKLH